MDLARGTHDFIGSGVEEKWHFIQKEHTTIGRMERMGWEAESQGDGGWQQKWRSETEMEVGNGSGGGNGTEEKF